MGRPCIQGGTGARCGGCVAGPGVLETGLKVGDRLVGGTLRRPFFVLKNTRGSALKVILCK